MRTNFSPLGASSMIESAAMRSQSSPSAPRISCMKRQLTS